MVGLLMKIDWKFIGELEGQSLLVGYVPDEGESGVTVATGVDVGQMTEGELVGLGLSVGLTGKLGPYVGLKRADAHVALAKFGPLVLTQSESDALDTADRKEDIEPLVVAYGQALGEAEAFLNLESTVQTVVASVAFQYGAGLRRRTPRFWGAAVRQDWPGLYNELVNFGDAYPTRRHREAAYLTAGLHLGKEIN